MKIVLHDNGLHNRFAPLTLTRPLGNLRIGILTNDERWKRYIPNAEIGYQTETFLAPQFGNIEFPDLIINAQVIPNEEVVQACVSLSDGQCLMIENTWIAKRGEDSKETVNYAGVAPIILHQRWDLFLKNDVAIEWDISLVTRDRMSQPISPSNTVIGDKDNVFIEEGAQVEASVLNTTGGSIYIGKSAEIMEGSLVRGPFALGEHAALKMGAKIYGATTVGPHCKVGGEVSNSIFYGYSNKGHDGFVGNSLIGEWCNLGADTNTSNLKNNYGKVSTYSYENAEEIPTDVQFMGLTMGDHSKCGINTMFNTASVIGVSVNLFGAGFPAKFVPSFSWGGEDGIVPYRIEKAIEYANAMMARRGKELSPAEIAIFRHHFNKK
jgi:UDP-N-acetylglucosamine diphosphorylase/glucosamine-1-phosphate N-acetyltransferase